MSSNNDSYYEKFMGFFGGVKDFNAVKLYIHALDFIKSKSITDLCQTFLCDLSKFQGDPSMPGYGLPYDMCVFIHHIYTNLLTKKNVDDNKPRILEAIKYVASLYNGGSYDIQRADRLQKIVTDHVKKINSNTGDITGLPKEWHRAIDVEFYDFSTPYTSVPGVPAYTFENPASVPMGFSGPSMATLTLANLLKVMDGEKTKNPAEYSRILAKKVSAYRLSEYEMKQLSLASVANAKPANTGSSAAYWAPKVSSASSTVGYYRRDGAPGKLYKLVKDASGNTSETEVQVGSKYHTDTMSKPNSCNDIHSTSSSSNDTCSKFVMDCLMGDKKGMDDAECKNVLKDSNFWNNTKKEVFEDMLPDVACSILDSFGFQKVKVTNGKYTNLNAFEEKSAWLARLNKNYSSDYDAISKNANLMSYLDMLLNKVNGSPAILNDNFYDKPNGTFNINRFNNSRLKMMGINGINTVINPGSVSLSNITNTLNSNISSSRLAFGFLPGVVNLRMIGGGLAAMSIQQRASQSVPSLDWAAQVQKNSPILRKLLEHYTSQLAAVDRQIDTTDQAKLDKAITDLENSEDLLVKNVTVMHEYLNIMLNYSDKYDETSKNETLENIKKFVESSGKRLDKIDKGTNSLVLTLQKLSDALSISVNGKTV